MSKTAQAMTGMTLYSMYAEPAWHMLFRTMVPKKDWPEDMKGETTDPWPDCLADKGRVEFIKSKLAMAERMISGKECLP